MVEAYFAVKLLGAGVTLMVLGLWTVWYWWEIHH